MIRRHRVSLPRCLAVGAGATLGCGLLVAWLLPIALTPGSGTFDAALVRACAALGVVAAGSLWPASVVTVAGAVRGRQAVGVPAPLRRMLLAACGVALTGGLAVPGAAHGTPGRLHEDRAARPVANRLVGLPLPERVAAPRSRHVVVVGPGDSLWTVAARRLGPGASDAEIDACWRRIYDLNRAAIGADPDLIHPAQRLEVLP